jgi:hypothetical protein
MKKVIAAVCALACIKAWACSCTSGQSPEIAYREAKAVFLGRVHRLELMIGKDEITPQGVECVFEVFEVLKGEALASQSSSRRLVKVSTGTGGGDCGVQFSLGQFYLVYAYGEATLETNICIRTKEFTRAAEPELNDLRRLGKK